MKYIYSVLPMPNIAGVNPLVSEQLQRPQSPEPEPVHLVRRASTIASRDKDLVYGRITKANASTIRPGAGGVPTLDGFGNSRTDTYPNKSLSLDWTHTFSPTFFNEFMFSASRTVTTNFSGDPSRQYYTENWACPTPNGQPGYPVINNIGVGTGSSNYFQPVNWNMQYFNYFILENNATKIKGKHELQFGIHLRHDQLNYMPQQQRTAGSVTFQANTTALYDPANTTATNRVAMLNTGPRGRGRYLGYAIYEVRVAKGMYYMRQNEDAAYFQDNWRATNRLTLNLGLRWQFSPYPTDKYNIFSSFDRQEHGHRAGPERWIPCTRVGATSPALVKALQGYGAKFETHAQDAGLPRQPGHNNWHDIGPHVGFAYRALDGPRSFVIRGGFSLAITTRARSTAGTTACGSTLPSPASTRTTR